MSVIWWAELLAQPGIVATRKDEEESTWRLAERQKLEGKSPFADTGIAQGFDTSLDIFDWDGDGLLDLVVVDVAPDKKPGIEVIWFRNEGTKQQPKFSKRQVLLSGNDVNTHNVVVVADWDSDGKKDLLIFRAGMRVAYNRGLPQKPEWEIRNVSTEGWDAIKGNDIPGLSPMILDWNGDGKRDIVGAKTHGGHAYVWPNVGTDNEPVIGPAQEIQADGAKMKMMELSPCAADVDGDGAIDLVVSSYGGVLYLCKNTAACGKPPVLARPVPLQDPNGPIKMYGRNTVTRVVDFNGDGVMDLVFVCTDYTKGEMRGMIWWWPGSMKSEESFQLDHGSEAGRYPGLVATKVPAAQLARRWGISELTLYRWHDGFLTGGEAALAHGKNGADVYRRELRDLQAQLAERDQVSAS